MIDCVSPKAVWYQISIILRKHFGAAIWNSWFAKLIPINATDATLTLNASNDFIIQWIFNHYGDTLRRLSNIKIIIVTGQSDDQTNDIIHLKEINIHSASQKTLAPTLNVAMTFDTFVIGGSNHLAFEIAKNLASLYPDNVPDAYRPLYIHGPVGVGKTHLMHSIGWKLVEQDATVMYITSHDFLSKFTKSLRERTLDDFTNELMSYDAILLDDFQFLVGKERTQEYFFNIFNTIISAKKIIIISSDQLPAEFIELEKRMRSRLGGGMTATIYCPDYELKLNLLKALDDTLSFEVVDVLAKLDISIRELKGALTRVTTHAKFTNSNLDIDFVNQALHDLIASPGLAPTMDEIISAVSVYAQKNMLKITKDQLRIGGRSATVSILRQIFMYLSHEIGSVTPSHIGKYLNNRDRTTIAHGVKKVKELLKADRHIIAMTREIKNILGN